MKAWLLGLLLWQAAERAPGPSAEQRYLRYERAVTAAQQESGTPACATLDATVFAHGAPSLKDVRLYNGAREVPYAITLSESAEADSEPARVLNLGLQSSGLQSSGLQSSGVQSSGPRGSKIVFDLEMPARPYTDVVLDLEAQNFIGAAEVSGTNGAGRLATRLGTFTLFDLTAQHLSRSTVLHLQEASFRTLHVELSLSSLPGSPPLAVIPGIVAGAMVPPNREAQTVYTMVAETATVTQRGRQTVASFRLPAHVPVERVSFAIAPGFTGNFSRNVEVTGKALADDAAMEALAGNILRVRMNEAGREIRQEQLGVPATLGANLQADATVEVLVDNGDDVPLPLSAVRLEMRERRLCFPASAATGPTLFYGDAALDAPVYDYARLFSVAGGVVAAKLGAEQQNPAYVLRPETVRSLTERHPELLWIVLLTVVCVLAVVALHSAKRMPK